MIKFSTLLFSVVLSFVFFLSCGTENKPIYNFIGKASPEIAGSISPSFGQYEEGKSLEVRAIPTPGWEFDRWEGDLAQSENPTKITINKEYNVVGVFKRINYPLTITIVGEGTVQERVISSPKATEYPFETVVQLTPNPTSFWEFEEWSGDVSSTDKVIEVIVNDKVNITATFVEIVLKDGEVYNPTTGRIWMDRNLGASRVAQSSTDREAYGDLYQWGRAADGHQKRNSGTTSTLSSSDQPGHGDFILAPDSPRDWRSPQNDNLWQGVNGINNPCPSGYRLPTLAEWQTEKQSWSSNNAAGAFASPLKLPVAGFRYGSSGSFLSVSTFGRYWSVTADGVVARFLYFSSDTALMSPSVRADGRSVRCIKV